MTSIGKDKLNSLEKKESNDFVFDFEDSPAEVDKKNTPLNKSKFTLFNFDDANDETNTIELDKSLKFNNSMRLNTNDYDNKNLRRQLFNQNSNPYSTRNYLNFNNSSVNYSIDSGAQTNYNPMNYKGQNKSLMNININSKPTFAVSEMATPNEPNLKKRKANLSNDYGLNTTNQRKGSANTHQVNT